MRHWVTLHRSEREVQDVLVADKERRPKEIMKLRNMGNHLHNCQVVRDGKGDFLVTYRPTQQVCYSDYVPCEACFAYIHKRELWRHRCKLKSKSKGRGAASAALLLPTPAGTSSKVLHLIDGMQNPDLKLLIRNDNILCSFAAKMLDKHSMKKKAYVHSHLLLLAGFVVEMRKTNNTCSLRDCISPSKFREVVQAVKNVAGYDEDTGMY
jgi:hypothetical protein